MKDLSIRARFYVIATLLTGIVLMVRNLWYVEWNDGWMLGSLSLLASLSLILKVEGTTNRSHYNISFLIYAFTFVLLGPEATVLVILVSNVAEWLWHRYPWYIQCFNIGSYVVVVNLAGLVYRWSSTGQVQFSLNGVGSILLAMLTFTLFNHLLVGLVIWLARDENFLKSGIFDFFPLMLDFTLLSMGAGAALVWIASPYAAVFLLLPLYLIYSTLKVPSLERKTETDAKTGLFNARYFEQAVHNELKRANRFDRPLTMVMADLDLLRNINNTYGHLAGDEVLKGIANILKASVREYDVVARFGGEEFAILMPETTTTDAFPRIESIRKAIEEAEFAIQTSVTPIRATMSFGISGRVGFAQTVNEIIHNADAALYHAKLKGRNGTYIYSEEGFLNLFNRSGEVEIEVAPVINALPEAPAINFEITEAFNATEVSIPLRDAGEEVKDEAAKPEPKAKSQPKWMVNLYITSLAVLALILFGVIYQPRDPVDWLGLAIFTVMVVLTEWLSIDIYVRNTAVSTSAAPILAGTLLFGPVGSLVLSLTFAAVAMFKHRIRMSRFIFNACNQLIAGMIYSGLIYIAVGKFDALSPAPQFFFSLFAVAIVYLVTTFLISGGMSLDTGLPGRELWAEQFGWLAPYYFAMGLIGFALIFSYQTAGVLGSIVILIPLLLLRFSQKQYIDRTKQYVNELKEKNTALEKSSEEIQKLNEALLDTLAEVVDLRDPYVLGHSKQVARYAVQIAKKLNLHPKQVDLIRKAGLLHDIGKLGISESILFKPDKLTRLEYDIVKEHVTLGADILEKTHSLKQLIPIIRHHHERYDGHGYPDGLTSNQIPLEARIIGVADAVEAMASDRPYRRGRNRQEIIDELSRHAGTQFDPLIARVLMDILRADPGILNDSPTVTIVLEEHAPLKRRAEKSAA